MIAVTIATPDYADLAHEQAKHFAAMSGLRTSVIHVAAGDGFRAKLDLPNLAPRGRIVFFDADYRLISPYDLTKFEQGCFSGVPDPTASAPGDEYFVAKDCRTHELNPGLYLNTGFFVCDTSSNAHQRVFWHARQMWEERARGMWSGMADVTEQTILNCALQREMVNIGALPVAWNFFAFAHQHGFCQFPTGIYGIHAAAVVGAEGKSRHLNSLHSILQWNKTPHAP